MGLLFILLLPLLSIFSGNRCPSFRLLALSSSLTLSSVLTHTADAAIFRNLGVDYGQLGDDLPSPARSVRLLRSLRAGAVKIYDANPAILKALSGSHLKVSIMVPNQLIPSLAANRSLADAWVQSNLLPFYPRTRVRFLLVGNEILSDSSIIATWPDLVPAIANIKSVLKELGIHNIKVGTPLAMDALQASFPPSAGAFRSDIAEPVIRPLLRLLNKTRSYYFVDVYPYFAWAANPGSIRLDYALFKGDSSINYVDTGSGLTYTNLLDQQLDAVAAAMGRMGFPGVRIAIAETGWPNAGDLDQIGANVYNAATYNRNLARRIAARPPTGTPARPGAWMPVFVFSLYNENQKPGPGTERHWGLLYPNGTRVYEVDLSGRRPDSAYPPLPAPTNDAPYRGRIWCVLAGGRATKNATVVGAALSYACGQGNGTCDAIQPGGACYRPDTLAAHARYAFNAYWQQFRQSGGNCYFGGLAVETAVDPSYGSCKYPSGTQ